MFKKIFSTLWKAADRLERDQVTVYSAQAAYFVVVSVIPFAMLLVSLIQFFVPDNIETLINTIVLVLPGELGDKAAEIIYSLFHSSGSMISLSVLITLWAASRGIMGLQSGLHIIYHVTEKDNYLVRRLKCILYTFIFIIAIILALCLLVLGDNFEVLIQENFTFLGQVVRIILALRFLLTVAVFITAFTFGYRFLTGIRCPFLEALPGVLLSTIGWTVFSFIFSIYMTHFSIYSSLYGSLGAVILLFLWIYSCILILMVGAELNVYLEEKRGVLNLHENDRSPQER